MQKLEEQEFCRQMQEKCAQIEALLQEMLPKDASMQQTVVEAMEYSVLAGGKRLRPMLMGESYALFGGTEKDALRHFMAAMELIHTYSLVHDDLPAMDNDDYRRGRETTHRKFGEDMGILAGDALLNYAYEVALAGVAGMADVKRGVTALQILSGKAGVYGMVGGQVVDVEQTGRSLTGEQLRFIYQLKTGALLEAALMVGAVLAGASEEEIRQMEEIGKNVGFAFQIQDDILDVTSTRQELGKPIGSDARNEKRTYVAMYGMEAAKDAVEEYSGRALHLLEQLPAENVYLNTLIQMLVHRRR